MALWRDGLIEERAGDPARSHAERLPGDLAALLGAHGLPPRDVERYAVAAGPGSFTGLRIGIATVQGLALVGDRLVHAVGTLDLLAHDAARAGDAVAGTTIVAWMEAYRGEVFAARYRVVQAAPLPNGATASSARRGDPRRARSADRVDAGAAGAGVGRAPAPATSSSPATAWRGCRRCSPRRSARTPRCASRGRSPARWPRSPPRTSTRRRARTRVVPIYVRRPDVELARDRAAVRPTA